MLARVAQLQGVDDQAHVGAVLSGAGGRRDVDQLDAELVQVSLGFPEPRPITVGATKDHLAHFQQAAEGRLQVEIRDTDARVGHQVLEVDEERNAAFGGRVHD